jgi:hypothetical protein
MNHHEKIQLDILEDDIDHGGLTDLLQTIRDICHSKSGETEHRDDSLQRWYLAAQTINCILPRIKELVG